jgi:hypothetical protein
MDEHGLLLLFSSFPFALLLIMLTEVAEQQTQAAAERERAPPTAFPAGAGAKQLRAVQDPRAWDVRRFFYA